MKDNRILKKLKAVLDQGLFGFSFESILLTALLGFRVLWNYWLILFMEENGRRIHFYDRFAKIVFLLMLMVSVLRFVICLLDSPRKKPDPCYLLILAYAFLGFLSSLLNYGADVYYERRYFMALIELFMVTVVMYRTAPTLSEKRFQNLLEIIGWFLFVIVLVLNILSLVLYFGGADASLNLFGRVYQRKDLFDFDNHNGIETATRYYGLYGNPVVMGNRAAIACLLALHLTFRKRMKTFLSCFLYLSSLVLVILSDSRASLINLLVMAWFMLAEILQKKLNLPASKAYGYPALAGLAGIAGGVILKWNSIMKILSRIKADPVTALNAIGSGRVNLFLNCMKLAGQKPLYGHGWLSMVSKYLNNAHNIYANAAAWTGYTGLILLIVFTAAVTARLFRNKTRIHANPFLLCLILCVFIQSVLDKAILGEVANAETYLFWLCLGYFCFGVRMDHSEPELRKA